MTAAAPRLPDGPPTTDEYFIVNAIADAIDVERGPHVPDWPEDERDLHRNGSFPSLSHRSAALRELRHRKAAYAILASLSDAGYLLEAMGLKSDGSPL